MERASVGWGGASKGASEWELLNIEAVDVEALVRNVRLRLNEMARRSRIELIVLVPRVEPVPLVAADRERLEQVLMSLGSNAVEYSRLGCSVRIRLWQSSSEQVRIAITHTGMGIRADQQLRLFDLPDDDTHTPPGAGRAALSLARLKQWVEQMHGELAFWSQLGVGSTFWVDLPIHRA